MIFGTQPSIEDLRRQRTQQETKLQRNLERLAGDLEKKDTIENCLKIYWQIMRMEIPYEPFRGTTILLGNRDFERHYYSDSRPPCTVAEFEGDNLHVRVSIKYNQAASRKNLLELDVKEENCIGQSFLELEIPERSRLFIEGTNIEFPKISPLLVRAYKPEKWEDKLREIAKHDFVREAAEYVKREERKRLGKLVGERYSSH